MSIFDRVVDGNILRILHEGKEKKFRVSMTIKTGDHTLTPKMISHFLDSVVSNWDLLMYDIDVKEINESVVNEDLETPLFSKEDIDDIVEQLKTQLHFPYKSVQPASLGDRENVSIMLTVSLDKKEEWPNEILENSRYARFRVENNGTVENFSGNLPHITKFRVKSINELIEKLQEKIKE
jgi:hypothetical protein